MRFKHFLLKENVEAFDLEYFKNLKTFNQRLTYCRLKLKKLGSGSSREVFEYSTDYVIKVAKNVKGLEQNTVESDYGAVSMYDFLPKIKDNSDDGEWVIVEKCDKINAKEFETLTKTNWEFFKTWLSLFSLDYIRHKQVKYTPEMEKELDNDDSFICQLNSFMVNFDIMPGDFEKLSSFGKHNNKIKIIDWGFTQTVFKTHYSK